mmetsp:Transcript_608/g.1408  ORF Transcript_608/g.1408 Transcript_608/m.1408 type:complete len:232 (-) Transcript_608:2194-2889(-)
MLLRILSVGMTSTPKKYGPAPQPENVVPAVLLPPRHRNLVEVVDVTCAISTMMVVLDDRVVGLFQGRAAGVDLEVVWGGGNVVWHCLRMMVGEAVAEDLVIEMWMRIIQMIYGMIPLEEGEEQVPLPTLVPLVDHWRMIPFPRERLECRGRLSCRTCPRLLRRLRLSCTGIRRVMGRMKMLEMMGIILIRWILVVLWHRPVLPFVLDRGIMSMCLRTLEMTMTKHPVTSLL